MKSQPTIPLLSVQPPSGYYFISVTVSRSSSPWPTEDERGRRINCPKPAKRDFRFIQIQNYLTVHYFDMLIWIWKYISEYGNQYSKLKKEAKYLRTDKKSSLKEKQKNMLSNTITVFISVMVHFPIQTHPMLAHKKVIYDK